MRREAEAEPPISRLEVYFTQGQLPHLSEDVRRALCRDLYGAFAEDISADHLPAYLPKQTDNAPATAAALCSTLREKAGLTPEEVLFALRMVLCLGGMELLLDVIFGRKGAVRSLAGAVQTYCDAQIQI